MLKVSKTFYFLSEGLKKDARLSLDWDKPRT